MISALEVHERRIDLAGLPIDQSRGWCGMWCVIATEFMLFVCMFGAYYLLGNNKYRWAQEMPPKLRYPILLLLILLTAAPCCYGEKQVKRGRDTTGRLALWTTVAMGVGF